MGHATNGTPEGRPDLDRGGTRATAGVVAAVEVGAVVGFAVQDHLEVCRRFGQPDRGGPAGCSTATVGKWRRRFVEKRLDGLTDEPRPGGPRSVRDDVIEQVVVETLERTPRDATHWSRSSMAAESGLSASTVGRIWRAFGLSLT